MLVFLATLCSDDAFFLCSSLSICLGLLLVGVPSFLSINFSKIFLVKLTPSILPSTPVLGRGIWLVGQGRVGWLWDMAGNGCGCVIWIGCSACWFDWVGWVFGCSNFGLLLLILATGILVVVDGSLFYPIPVHRAAPGLSSMSHLTTALASYNSLGAPCLRWGGHYFTSQHPIVL